MVWHVYTFATSCRVNGAMATRSTIIVDQSYTRQSHYCRFEYDTQVVLLAFMEAHEAEVDDMNDF
jgi:hypothetical protein